MKTPIEKIPQVNISFFKEYIKEGQTKICFNDGTKEHEIRIVQVPSNLGIGFINYFVCPHTHKRCRILYKPHGHEEWLSRTAWKGIRYWLQLRSGNNREWSQYHNYKRKVEELELKVKKEKYKGKTTKSAFRLFILKGKEIHHLTKALKGMPY